MIHSKSDALELGRLFGYYSEKKASTFQFQGKVYVVGYAKYLVEYLGNRMFAHEGEKEKLEKAVREGQSEARRELSAKGNASPNKEQ